MEGPVSLLACPTCAGALSDALDCAGCGRAWSAPDDIPLLRETGDGRTETVREFYEAAPFPGYPPRDSLERLRETFLGHIPKTTHQFFGVSSNMRSMQRAARNRTSSSKVTI